MGKIRLNNNNKNESIMQYYYQYDKGNGMLGTDNVTQPSIDVDVDFSGGDEDDYEATLFPNTVNALAPKKIASFNNTEDIKRVNSYMDFLYENGDVYVDGTWYKTPYDAIREYKGGIAGIKMAIQLGKVCRRLGLQKIY